MSALLDRSVHLELWVKVKDVANRDLTYRVEGNYRGDHAKIKH